MALHPAPLRGAIALVVTLALVAAGWPALGRAQLAAGAPTVVPAAASATARARLAALPALRLAGAPAAWVAPGLGRHTVDDFEGGPWPDPSIWPLVSDLTGAADGEYLWAPSPCRAATGSASLRAVGGGSAGSALACGAPYPPAQQTSAVLALDLSALHSAGGVELVFDVWADAAPDEGLFINHLVFGPDGALERRRVVYSATGRASAWARGIRLDLADLRDALDPSWRMDLRGRRAYLELAFLSSGAVAGGEGIYVDNLAVDAHERPPVIVTPAWPTATPVPADRTSACGREPHCKTVIVQAFEDFGCDGRYRRGLDFALRGAARVDIVAGTELLGVPLGTSDTLYFRVPMAGDATVTVSAPPEYRLCPGLADPRLLRPSDFGSKDFVKLIFGYMRN